PEFDGRLHAGVVSFKSAGERDGDLQFAHVAHRPDSARVDSVVARVCAWHRLATVPAHDKQFAIVLSSYPGRPHQIAHAVGLDALVSTEALLGDLAKAGFDVGPVESLARQLGRTSLTWGIDEYHSALKRLPQILRDNLDSAWGASDNDPQVHDGEFHFMAVR